MLRRITVFAVVVGIGALIPYVDAASVRLKKGSTVTDNGLTATVEGALTGLGNEDVTITIIAEGDGSVVLVNPSGQFVPGQNRFPLELTASETIAASEIKNGNLSFSITTTPPEDPDPLEAGAPNPNWDAFFSDVEFDSVTIIVEQGGKVVLTKTF